MKKQILYLLGAGASAGALPMISDFLNRVELQIKYLKSINLDLLKSDSPINFIGVFGTYLEELTYLENILRNSDTPSIDTIAHSYYISGRTNEYFRLKRIYSLFLLLEQRLNFHDRRYTQFISSIISSETKRLPDNIRVLSWNYDNQFELAYSHFTHNSNLENVRSEIGYNAIESEVVPEGFSFTKINGSIDMKELIHLADIKTITQNRDIDSQFVQLKGFLVIVNNTYNLFEHKAIEFAWEKNISSSNFIQFQNVTDVVVISYSFPDINNTIDRMFFSTIKNLENVYIQCGDSSEAIKEKLEERKYPSITSMQLHTKHSVSVDKKKDSFRLVY